MLVDRGSLIIACIRSFRCEDPNDSFPRRASGDWPVVSVVAVLIGCQESRVPYEIILLALIGSDYLLIYLLIAKLPRIQCDTKTQVKFNSMAVIYSDVSCDVTFC